MASFDWGSNACFVCGSGKDGLHVRFAGNADEVRADVQIDALYQGFDGLVHGGILAGIVDDAMWHAIHQQHGDFPVTAELTIRYHKPARIAEPLTVVGRLVSYRRRLMVAEAVIENHQGETVVSAEGRFMPIPKERMSGS